MSDRNTIEFDGFSFAETGDGQAVVGCDADDMGECNVMLSRLSEAGDADCSTHEGDGVRFDADEPELSVPEGGADACSRFFGRLAAVDSVELRTLDELGVEADVSVW